MAKRASLRGKGVEIFYTNGEQDEAATAPETPPAEAAPRQPRTKKPKLLPAVAPESAPALADTVAPPPDALVVKTPATVLAAPAPPPSAPLPEVGRTPPPAAPIIPPVSLPTPAPAAPPPTGGTIPERYERLAREIDDLYEVATRKMAAGRGVGQTMQWLSEARKLVVAGKAADFAQAEWLVRQVSGLLKHGDEIDHLYAEVLEQVGDNPGLVKQCMDSLHLARPKIMTGRLEDLIEAEFLLEEVKGLLTRVQKSRAASHSWGTRLLWVWLVAWLAFLLGLFILDRPLAETLHARGWPSSGSLPPSSLAQFMLPWLCLLWGAVGSVFDTLIAINEHMAKRTYDGHYVAQGFASPIYGAILGILIYFLFTGGVVAISTGVAFSSLGGTTAMADVQATANTASRSLALWVVAFLAGFFHNRTFDLLSKVFDQFLITLKILPEAPKEEAAAAPAAAGKPVVTVTAPAAGSQVRVGDKVPVQVTAVDASGVSRVELWADGALMDAQKFPSPQPTVAVTLYWTAASAGGHALMVKAYNVAESASDPVTISILATDEGAGPPEPPEGPPEPPEGPPPGDVIT